MIYRATAIACLLLLAGTAVQAQETMKMGGVPAASVVVAGKKAAVVIDNFSFGPASITVASGTKVTWTNKDDDPHTVTSDAQPPLFKSHALDTDETFSMVFDKPGTYAYFCSLHPQMQGVVIVK
jgi:plastocyanin